MKKSVAPRIAGLFLLYLVIFTVLVVVQFSNRRSFTRHIGAMTLNVHFKTPNGEAAPEFPAGTGSYPLDGDASVSLGGMEFRLDGAEGFFLLTGRTEREAVTPELLVIDENSVVFYFPSAAEKPDRASQTRLIFTCLERPAGPELRISGIFTDGYTGAEIPYRPLRQARVRDGGDSKDGGFVITAGGVTFGFSRTELDTERQLVILENDAIASYRAAEEQQIFRPGAFALQAALDRAEWTARINQWREQIFASWGRTPTASLNDEELLAAYAAEAVHRERYKEVISRIPRSFLDGTLRTYVSSVFLGGMNQALRSFITAEQGRSRRLTALLRDNPAAFFAEPHLFAENYHRDALFDEGLEALAAREPPAPDETLPLELVPAFLEHWADWPEYAGSGTAGELSASRENPFEPWARAALDSIGAHLLMDGNDQWVFLFEDETAETAFNLRLGLALDRYGRGTAQGDWAALGRSLALSVLALTDAAGTLPVAVNTAGLPAEGTERVSAARFYPYLAPGNYPHLESLPGPGSPLLIWTAADALTSTWDGDILDIAVSFPSGETHYLIIRNLRPFTRIQLYGIDYRTDAQFERYDSSGWVYNSAERSLLVKMRHRAREEHIRIVYTPPPPPPRPVVIVPPPAPVTTPVTGAE